MKLCICSKILQDKSLEDAVRISAEIGYNGIELFGLPNHLPVDIDLNRVKDLRKLGDDLGMKVVTLATYVGGYSQLGDEECARQLDDFKRYVQIGHILNCDLIRQGPGGPTPDKAREDHWQRSAYWLQKAADYGLANEVNIVLENNFVLVATVDSTLKLIHLIDRPNVGINYDPGNIYRASEQYGVEAVRRFGELIFNVQIKDADKTDGDNWKLLLGEGKVDYLSIFKALKRMEYKGYYSAESHKEPTEGLDTVGIARHEYQKIKELLEKAEEEYDV